MKETNSRTYFNRFPELDFVRSIAIIAVVAIHISIPLLTTGTTDKGSFLWGVVLNQLGRFSVPVFLFISGLLARSSVGKRRFKEYIRKRSKDLLVPYVMWTVIGIMTVPTTTRATLLYAFIMGQGPFYQLYFIPLLFQMYLLTPIISKITIKAWVVMGVTLGSLGFIGMYQLRFLGILYSPGFLPEILVQRLIQASFPAWILYFITGYFFGKDYHRLINLIRNKHIWKFAALWIFGAMLLLLDYCWGFHKTGVRYGAFADFYRPVVVLYSFISLVTLLKIGVSFGTRNRMIKSINENSFGIYLSHLLVIIFLEKILPGYFFTNGLLVSLIFVLCIGISYLISVTLKATPFSEILLGQLHSQKR